MHGEDARATAHEGRRDEGRENASPVHACIFAAFVLGTRLRGRVARCVHLRAPPCTVLLVHPCSAPPCSHARLPPPIHHREEPPVKHAIRRRTLAAVLTLVCAVTLTLTAAVPNGRPEDVGLSSERLQRINEVVQRYIGAREIAGGVTVVTRRGKVAHFEAHGMMDLESKTPMRKDGIFRIASMTQAGHRRGHPDAGRGREGPPLRPGVALHPRVQGHEGRRREAGARRVGAGSRRAGAAARRRRKSR